MVSVSKEAAAQLRYQPAQMQTMLEDPLHESSRLPAPTWAEMLQQPLLLLFKPHFANASIKWKKLSMNTTPLALFISAVLMPRQAEHPGKGGGSKCRGETGGKQVTQTGNKHTKQKV